jgi:hypothetical protein
LHPGTMPQIDCQLWLFCTSEAAATFLFCTV